MEKLVSDIVASFASSRSWASDGAESTALEAVEKARVSLAAAEAALEEARNRETLASQVVSGIAAAMAAAGLNDPAVVQAAAEAALDKRFPKAQRREVSPRDLETVLSAIGENEEVDVETLALRASLEADVVRLALEKARKEGKAFTNGKRGRGCLWHLAARE